MEILISKWKYFYKYIYIYGIVVNFYIKYILDHTMSHEAPSVTMTFKRGCTPLVKCL